MRRRPYNRLDQAMVTWISRTAQKNYWRVASWYGLDDLIQDGFLAFVICSNKYSSKVSNQRQFMALFKRVYTNMIHDMAKAKSKRPEELAIADVFDEEESDYLPGDSLGLIEPDAELFATLSSAPPHIKALLELVQSPKAPAYLRHRTPGPQHRETTKAYLDRVLNLGGVDIEAELRGLLYGTDTLTGDILGTLLLRIWTQSVS